jgi:uncharacterized protein RhaS with RHS repeats
MHFCAHIFTSATTHFATLWALFFRRRCRRGNFPSFNNLRRFAVSRPSRARAKALIPEHRRRNDLADNRTTVQDSKGGLATFGYDAKRELTSVQFTGQSATLSYEYQYDAIGEVANVKRYNSLTTMSLLGVSGYNYDTMGDVTAITHQQFGGGPPTVIQALTYTYDVFGRMTTKDANGTTTTYSYDTNNQLTNDSSATYTYDANGNRTMSGYDFGLQELVSDVGIWARTCRARAL